MSMHLLLYSMTINSIIFLSSFLFVYHTKFLYEVLWHSIVFLSPSVLTCYHTIIQEAKTYKYCIIFYWLVKKKFATQLSRHHCPCSQPFFLPYEYCDCDICCIYPLKIYWHNVECETHQSGNWKLPFKPNCLFSF